MKFPSVSIPALKSVSRNFEQKKPISNTRAPALVARGRFSLELDKRTNLMCKIAAFFVLGS